MADEKEADSLQPPSKQPRLSCADSNAGAVTMAVSSPLGLGLGLGLGGDSRGEQQAFQARAAAAAAKSALTFMQQQELEHQVLIYRYFAAGAPVPVHLVLPIWKSVAASSFGPHRFPSRTFPMPPRAVSVDCSMSHSSSLNGSDWAGEPVLRLPEQHGAGARAVPPHGRQEVAVLPRRGAGAQVLRAARPPGPRPFKKACGRSPGAQRQPHHRPRLLPRRHPPRHPQRRRARHLRPRASSHPHRVRPSVMARGRGAKSCRNEIRRDFVASCNFFLGSFSNYKPAEFDGMRPCSSLCVRL